MKYILYSLLLLSLCTLSVNSAEIIPPGIDRTPEHRVEFPYSPADGAVWDANPKGFTFLAPTDWKPGKYTYTLQYSQDSTFASPDTVTLAGRSIHMYLPDQPLKSGKWFWRYGVERAGQTPYWSKVRSFTVPENIPLHPFPGIEKAIAGISKGHPRIYFTPESAAELRKRALHGDLKKAVQIRLKAHKKLIPADIPEGEPPAVNRSGDRAAYLASWRKANRITHPRLAKMENLALTYLLSGQEEYAKATADYVRYFFSLDPDGTTAIDHNDEPGMMIMRRGISSYDWTHDFYTPEEHKMIRKNIKLRAQRIYEYLRRNNFDCRPYGSHQHNGYQAILLEASIFLAPDDPDPAIREWMSYALTTYRTTWPAYGFPDGGWTEGPAYWSNSIDRGLRMLAILRSALGMDLTNIPFIKNTGYYVLHGWPGRSELYSGCDAVTFPRQARQLYMLAIMLGNPDFLQPAMARNLDPLKEDNTTVLTYLSPAENLGKPAPEKLPKARLFPDVGFVSMRKTVTGCEDDLGLIFQSCPAGNMSHRQNSQNNFQMEAYGESLFFSSGHYDAQRSPHYSDWTVESRSHNCITYDGGKGQIRGGNAQGKIVHFADKGDSAVATGDASAAYPELKNVRRTIVHLRPDIFLIRDRSSSELPRTFEFNLHTKVEYTAAELADGFLLTTPRGGCRVALLDQKPWKCETWTGFRINPVYRASEPFPDRRHFRFSLPAPAKEMDLITVFLPFVKGKETALPQVRREGNTVILTGVDGKITRICFEGDDASVM